MSDFTDKFRKHQLDAFEFGLSRNRALFTMPTGSGKSWVEAAQHIHEMSNAAQPITTLIVAPLLGLCDQMLMSFSNNTPVDLEYDIAFMNSSTNREMDNLLESTLGCSVKRTTCPDEIAKVVEESKSNWRHLIIVSTYLSVDNLKGIDIALATYDEAHLAHTAKTIDKIKSLTVAKEFFFTATPRYTSSIETRVEENINMHMGDEFEVLSRDLSDIGIISPVVSHIIYKDEDDSRSYKYDRKQVESAVIQRAFLVTRDKFNSMSAVPGETGVKMLINAADKKSAMKYGRIAMAMVASGATSSKVFVVISESPDDYHLGSAYCSIDGVKVDTAEAKRQLCSLTIKEEAIIIHVRMLTVGIDVPLINSVLFMSIPGSASSIIQTVGRGRRSIPSDTKLFEEGVVNKDCYVNGGVLKKPFCMVTFTNVLGGDTEAVSNAIGKLEEYTGSPIDIEYTPIDDDVQDVTDETEDDEEPKGKERCMCGRITCLECYPVTSPGVNYDMIRLRSEVYSTSNGAKTFGESNDYSYVDISKYSPETSYSKGEKYEAYVCGQLELAGEDAKIVGGSGDHGCDIVVGDNIVLQCKNRKTKSSEKDVDEVLRAKDYMEAKIGMLMSKAGYSEECIRYANRTGVVLLYDADLFDINNAIIRAIRV